jgi:hypothetical protein
MTKIIYPSCSIASARILGRGKIRLIKLKLVSPFGKTKLGGSAEAR